MGAVAGRGGVMIEAAAGVVCLLLFGYLIYSLLKPEAF